MPTWTIDSNCSQGILLSFPHSEPKNDGACLLHWNSMHVFRKHRSCLYRSSKASRGNSKLSTQARDSTLHNKSLIALHRGSWFRNRSSYPHNWTSLFTVYLWSLAKSVRRSSRQKHNLETIVSYGASWTRPLVHAQNTSQKRTQWNSVNL